jgi:hypothetical protein
MKETPGKKCGFHWNNSDVICTVRQFLVFLCLPVSVFRNIDHADYMVFDEGYDSDPIQFSFNKCFSNDSSIGECVDLYFPWRV